MQMDSRSSHPRILRGASERSFFDKSASGGFASEDVYMYICMYIFLYIDIYNIQYTLSPKKSKNQKHDEFNFSIMRSGAQNRFKSNPLTQFGIKIK